MHRFTRIALVVLCLLLASVTLASAQVRVQALTLTPMVGYQWFDSDLNLDDDVFYGLAVGYTVSKNWALELDMRFGSTEADEANGPDVDVATVTGNVLYHFMPEKDFVPYLVGGIGGVQYGVDGTGSDDEDFIANWGGGFKYAVSDDIALRLDLRHVIDFRTDNGWTDQDGSDVVNNFAAAFGVTFQFDGVPSTPVVVNR